jgi:hypothetical protein
MLDLQPLIDRLVEDVLRAVRGASLDELRELLAAGRPARVRRPPAAVPRAAPARRQARPQRPVRTAATSAPRKAARTAFAPEPAVPEPPAFAEITDPERLLAATVAPRGATAPLEAPPTDLEREPPPSAEQPTSGATARLRAGESLARATGAGVVIRRAKRA